MLSFRNRKISGFTLVEMMVSVALISILVLLQFPAIRYLIKRAANTSAISAGRNAKMTQELYYTSGKVNERGYCKTLEGLLKLQDNLTDDPQVTFTFIAADLEGYTFVTSHYRGDKSFRFEGQGNIR